MRVRDESGKFVAKAESTNTYGYYSRVLNKPFDTLKELQEAELEFTKAHEAELKAKEEKKADAELVKAAIVARVKAEANSKKAKAEAYKKYLEACDSADALVIEAKKAEKTKLSEFCEKYNTGFHDTITIDDVTYTYDYSYNTVGYVDPFTRLIDTFFKF